MGGPGSGGKSGVRGPYKKTATKRQKKTAHQALRAASAALQLEQDEAAAQAMAIKNERYKAMGVPWQQRMQFGVGSPKRSGRLAAGAAVAAAASSPAAGQPKRGPMDAFFKARPPAY